MGNLKYALGIVKIKGHKELIFCQNESDFYLKIIYYLSEIYLKLYKH